MKKWMIVLLAVLIPIGFIFMLVTGGFNKLTTFDENLQSAWAQVENQLKRRNDLIPNLVNTVKGYAKHEKELFSGIAEARAKIGGSGSISDKIGASNQMSSALSRLLVLVERYPELKANQGFNRLTDELSGTENRLSVERRRYNEAVKALNMYIRRFPGRLYAALFGFEKGAYFEVSEAEKAVPQVQF